MKGTGNSERDKSQWVLPGRLRVGAGKRDTHADTDTTPDPVPSPPKSRPSRIEGNRSVGRRSNVVRVADQHLAGFLRRRLSRHIIVPNSRPSVTRPESSQRHLKFCTHSFSVCSVFSVTFPPPPLNCPSLFSSPLLPHKHIYYTLPTQWSSFRAEWGLEMVQYDPPCLYNLSEHLLVSTLAIISLDPGGGENAYPFDSRSLPFTEQVQCSTQGPPPPCSWVQRTVGGSRDHARSPVSSVPVERINPISDKTT